ncbi:MAG: helix-turn-helix transcriptional regulator [Cypionkella sp.]|uniref:helix-turn-helix domain-containing protein n=1 Tax=Cypionkella sp. TaxID=2811411 RepID=UPI002730F972|nr:helix-turn-helix transcriptional regulator [Cypionkella sp.]MDP1576214.1 helix-turn-helix transcriptional regulator [Cypionkella sp.]MDP2049076.1 helix-turn-helix transcriptional regulator [Cypionkella sp.]
MANLKAMRSLSELGQNLKQARLSRRFSIAELATRADVSERTLLRLEKGDPGVGIGNLASVLAALGSPAALAEIMSPENDAVGFSRALQAVPKRGRSFKPGKPVPIREATEAQAVGPDDKPRERNGIGF